MRNFKATLTYDGTDFHGWQIQPDRRTVQGVLKSVVSEIEACPVDVQGAGRTDAGVHALGQVASFALNNPMPAANLWKAMNRLLPADVRVVSLDPVPSGFHARYTATGKLYEYRIWRDDICPPFDVKYFCHHPYPLDEPAMCEAAEAFTGRHDFRSLAAAGGGDVESTVRTIFSSTLRRGQGRLIYQVRGDGFLYHMVRNIVGTLFEVGRGRLKADEIVAVLDQKQKSAAGATAPAKGLFLVHVEYPDLVPDAPEPI
jgi:tRNA pseudouridine38-40 synthase